MKSRMRLCWIILMFALSSLACAPELGAPPAELRRGSSQPSAMSAPTIYGQQGGKREQILGTWRLVSYTDTPAGGEPEYRFGKNPSGIEIFTASGQVCGGILQVPFPALPADASAMNVKDWQQLYNSYAGFFGTYTFDESNSELIYHIQGSNLPSFNGTTQRRSIRLTDDRLVVYGQISRKGKTYTYERIFERVK